MALYNKNTNLSGPKVVNRSEKSAAVPSTTKLVMVVQPVAVANMQDTLDGYIAVNANTDTSTVKFDVVAAAGASAGEYVGLYIYSAASGEARLIQSNDAAASAAEVTVTVTKPFSSAVTTGDSVNIRRWEKLYIPKLFTSVNDFAETYISKNTNGSFNWTDSEAMFYTLRSIKDNGASQFIVLPVEESATTDLVDTLARTSDADFLAGFGALASKPEVISVPAQPALKETLSAANWASVYGAWQTFINSQATDDTVDPNLHSMSLVVSSASASTSVASTFRTSDWNSSSERSVLLHGQYIARSLTAGQTVVVDPCPAYCGIINRVSTGAPESLGQGVYGPQFTQVVDMVDLVENLTAANRLTLQSNGINALLPPSLGGYFQSQWTQVSSSSSNGEDPYEHFNMVAVRNNIWNTLQPVMRGFISRPNTAIIRAVMKSQISGTLDAFLRQKMVTDFTVTDNTTSADVAARTARFELALRFAPGMDYIELTLNARLGE